MGSRDASLGSPLCPSLRILSEFKVEDPLAKRAGIPPALLNESHLDLRPCIATRLASDDRLPLDCAELEALMSDPISFTGTAVDQVARVVARCREIIERHPEAAATRPDVRF